MFSKLKNFIKERLWVSPGALRWQEKRLLRVIERNQKRTDRALEQLQAQQKQQLERLQALEEENRMLACQGRNTALWQQMLTKIMQLTADPDRTQEQLPDFFRQCTPEEARPLEFLRILYRLRSDLSAAQLLEPLEREYAALALDTCLYHLHAEQDPTARGIIYDALKNEVFDGLGLAEREPADGTDRMQYLQMREILDRRYDRTYFPCLSSLFYEQALVKWYRQKTGRQINLKNPVTYSDKINWIKLYEHDPRKTLYSDKYAVREFVAQTVGEQYLIPLLGVWDDPDEIDFEALPEKFVLKVNSGCGWNIIVADKAALDIPAAVKKLKAWMQTNYAFCNGLELHYDGIRPRIIAEAYLENRRGGLDDYKVFCFGGKVVHIHYITDRYCGMKVGIYDRQWNRTDLRSAYPSIAADVEKPDNLEELIGVCEKLAAGFNHVRVDFYRQNAGQWKFGEMTFTSESGLTAWDPPEYDRLLGDLFQLPDSKQFRRRQQQ